MITLVHYPQMDNTENLRQKIVALQETAWPSEETKPWPRIPEIHITSFVLLDNDIAIGHVAVLRKIINHKGQTYKTFGLSEVVTHPDYQKSGYGLQLIKEAFKYIENNNPDISIFTCDPTVIPFYLLGGWSHLEGACLVGGTLEKPFRSDGLGLAVMIRFHSDKAKNHQEEFEKSDIYLELDENQLW